MLVGDIGELTFFGNNESLREYLVLTIRKERLFSIVEKEDGSLDV